MSKSLTFDCESASIESAGRGHVRVEAIKVDIGDVLQSFDAKEILRHFDDTDILDEIGVDRVKAYFELVEAEN